MRVRFYFDLVCPYSYLESHVLESAEDQRAVVVDWLPLELRPAPKPLLEPRGDHLRTDWTAHVYRRALELGIEIHLPRYQPRSTLPSRRACGRANRAGSGSCATRSTKRSSARVRTSRPTRRSPAPRSGRASTRTRRCRPPMPRPGSRASPRSGTAPNRPACAVCRRFSPTTGTPTGEWAGSSASWPARRSCPGRAKQPGGLVSFGRLGGGRCSSRRAPSRTRARREVASSRPRALVGS